MKTVFKAKYLCCDYETTSISVCVLKEAWKNPGLKETWTHDWAFCAHSLRERCPSQIYRLPSFAVCLLHEGWKFGSYNQLFFLLTLNNCPLLPPPPPPPQNNVANSEQHTFPCLFQHWLGEGGHGTLVGFWQLSLVSGVWEVLRPILTFAPQLLLPLTVTSRHCPTKGLTKNSSRPRATGIRPIKLCHVAHAERAKGRQDFWTFSFTAFSYLEDIFW